MVFYVLQKEYNLTDEQILDLSLRDIDFKITGYNEANTINTKKETTRTHSIDKVMEAISK